MIVKGLLLETEKIQVKLNIIHFKLNYFIPFFCISLGENTLSWNKTIK